MGSKPPHTELSRRERQIMDVIHRRGHATVSEVMRELPDAPSYSAVRSAMRLLREKGELLHEHDGKRYVYRARLSRDEVRQSALRHLVETFFEGSHARTVDAILTMSEVELPNDEIARIVRLIEEREGETER